MYYKFGNGRDTTGNSRDLADQLSVARVLAIDSQTDSHMGVHLRDVKHLCGIVNGGTEARWTSVEVGEQVHTRLLIRVSWVRAPHGPPQLGTKTDW